MTNFSIEIQKKVKYNFILILIIIRKRILQYPNEALYEIPSGLFIIIKKKLLKDILKILINPKCQPSLISSTLYEHRL